MEVADSAMQTTQKKIEEVLSEDPITQAIMKMKNEQLRLKKDRVDLRRKLRNAEARRSRLKKKAKQLTDEDLVHVMMWRKENRDKQISGEEAASSSGERQGGPNQLREEM